MKFTVTTIRNRSILNKQVHILSSYSLLYHPIWNENENIALLTLSERAAKSLSKFSWFLCSAATLARSFPTSSVDNALSFSLIQFVVSMVSLKSRNNRKIEKIKKQEYFLTKAWLQYAYMHPNTSTHEHLPNYLFPSKFSPVHEYHVHSPSED